MKGPRRPILQITCHVEHKYTEVHRRNAAMIFIRRLRKAIGKNERDTAEHIRSNEPVYRVDHIVKERYPTFVDALRDIDDALSMCYLFSSFPKGKVVKPHLVQLCRRVIVEFMHYVIATRALRKVFVSIKVDVDFKIMVTFTDFYVTLMGCVNYKLYHSLNLHYPPKLENEPAEPTDAEDEDEVSEHIASLNNKLKFALTNAVADDAPQIDDFPEVEGESNVDIKSEEEREEKFLNLFYGLKVFLGREDYETVDENVSTCREETLEELITEVQADDQASSSDEDDEGGDIASAVVPSDSAAKEAVELLQRYFEHEGCPEFLASLSGMGAYFLKKQLKHAKQTTLHSFFSPTQPDDSFGAEVSWDESLFVGSTFPESDPTVTHQIVDRPEVKKRYMNRYYVQPQWVYDCVNYRKLLPEQDYFMGEVLPPHLSPFVEEKEGDYVPPERLAMLRIQRGEG
ncbi:hypothetical protein HPB50_006266 [Hyalomma asiaticum]|uniref:Uncharacterized protein n=1 Tax=Hyalomma asiaticum TaxID=266040 RepID=A0ACB7SCY6_HYAAI|nr:hypothetical protein HPB50_006266 [Hyalomma asiaticum]